MRKLYRSLILVFFLSPFVYSNDLIYQEVLVTGGKNSIKNLSGSASLIDEETIQQFDFVDTTSLLARVPGVYIRTEDGYGLRPNIGIRGVTSDRSQKLTIMEDGILITPAPYSAPAAYYVPNVNRMSAVEVFKGPSSIAYGPNTVGGALNFVTPSLEQSVLRQIDLSAGSDGFKKARLKFGEKYNRFGYRVDALHYGTDGFKYLESGADTGFKRDDVNLRLEWDLSQSASLPHALIVKIGYAEEDADETYLGLSEEDFSNEPNLRYPASSLDNFISEHKQIHVIHSLALSDSLTITNKLYINRFDREWFKFTGTFNPGADFGNYGFTDIKNILLAGADAGESLDIYELLSGQRDSLTEEEIDVLEDTLFYTNNAREYGSQGYEFRANYLSELASWDREQNLGFRYHHDYIDRDHSVHGFRMLNKELVGDNQSWDNTSFESVKSDAYALHYRDQITRNDLTLNAGLRVESIEGSVDNYLADTSSNNDQTVYIPGAGLFYQYKPRWGFLFGVNKGFSPKGPKSPSSVDPEESINYEAGFRYTKDETQIDLIAFYSDYSNLLGRCRASDPCDIGSEFNGGDVDVSGLEFNMSSVHSFTENGSLSYYISYTFTETEFQSTFDSNFSQWGSVSKGDELPYIPKNQFFAQASVALPDKLFSLSMKYSDKMRELPGKGSYIDGYHTPHLVLFDLASTFYLSDELSVGLMIENLLDDQKVVSRRPFGARPNMPRTLKINLGYKF